MVMVGRIQRYVFRECLSGLLMTLGVILVAILLVDVVEQMRTIGSRTDIGIETAFQLTLMKTPGLLMETLPFSVLVGSILTYSRLNQRSEIPAIRAAGVSGWRFLGPVMGLAFAIGVLMVAVIDPLATRLNQEFQVRRAELLNTAPATEGGPRGDVWLSQGDIAQGEGADAPEAQESQAIITARRVVGRGEALEDVSFFFFQTRQDGTERSFSHRIDAERATLVPGFWQLEQVTENRPGGSIGRQALLSLPTTLRPDTLLSRFASPKTIPFWDLPRFIRDTRSAGLDVRDYVLKLHTLLATPFLMVAMALIGAVVCLRLARSGGVTQLIAAGALAGFVLFFTTRIAAGLSASGAAPPEAAAWCPPLFALFGVLAIIARIEDG